MAFTVIMRRQTINDPFINKPAYSLLAPDNWKVTGQITWVPGRPTPDVYIAANNPENTVAYQQFPTLFYQANVRENMDYMFPRRSDQPTRRSSPRARRSG